MNECLNFFKTSNGIQCVSLCMYSIYAAETVLNVAQPQKNSFLIQFSGTSMGSHYPITHQID